MDEIIRLTAQIRGEVRQLRAEHAALLDALKAATAFVELSTGNGVQAQPPEWAKDFDAEKIAKHARDLIAQVTA